MRFPLKYIARVKVRYVALVSYMSCGGLERMITIS